MSTGRVRVSLSELRGRTDRQLVVLIDGEMEKALELAAGGMYPEAETRYRKARTLLAVTSLSETERMEFENRLREVRAALERPRWRSASTCPAA